MNRLTLQQNIRTITTLMQDIEQRIIIIAFFILVALAAVYVYFVGTAILATVIHKEIRSEIISLNTQVADLEAEYLKSKNTVTYALAKEKGYVRLTNKTFITRSIYIGRAY